MPPQQNLCYYIVRGFFMTLRNISIIGFSICALVLCTAYYLEYQYMLATCQLCVLQRIVFMALGVTFLFGIFIKFSGLMRYVYSSILFVFAMFGALIAGRQLWLQYFAPPTQVSCQASIERLFDLYPILEAFKIILKGSGECASIDFTILGLSIAAWSFLLFGLFAIGSVYLMWLQKNRRI